MRSPKARRARSTPRRAASPSPTTRRHLYAFADECTAQGCSLAEGEFDDRRATIECANDGSVFDVETGEPIEGPAQDPLAVFAAREVDGWVEVATRPGIA